MFLERVSFGRFSKKMKHKFFNSGLSARIWASASVIELQFISKI